MMLRPSSQNSACTLKDKINVIIERRNFHNRIQQKGESFDDFLTDLRELSKTCSFCEVADCLEQRLRDRIIMGLRYGDIQKLLAEPQLTFERTVTIVRAEEAALHSRHEITGEMQPTACGINRHRF